jgi:GT2 family glycosyltransferase
MNMQIQPTVSVIIVNYNSGSYALDCIRSLNKQRDVNLEIIVVDNASKDDSLKLFAENLPDNVLLIKSPENLGFGRANNLAASRASAEFLLLLNPDTVIDDAYAIKNLRDTLLNKPNVGLLAPAVDEPRKNKQVLPRYRYPSANQLRYTKKLKGLPGKVAWVLGACMLVKRSVYNEIHGFDEDYFLYGEDVDICLRLRFSGYEIAYADDIRIMHVSGASEIGADTLDKWLRKRRGIYLFYVKQYDARDVLHIARKAILKSKFYLLALRLKALFSDKKPPAFMDKTHRLQATILVAEETIAALNNIKT